MKKLLIFIFIVLAVSPLGRVIAKQPMVNEEYILIDIVQKNPEGKVEVLEFFSYACIHCYQFEPKLKQWLKKTSSDMNFERVPAVFSNRMMPLAKLYYALEDIGMLDNFHDLVYEKIHVEKEKIFSKKAIFDWISSQPEIDYDGFVASYDSFAVGRKANVAKQLTRKFRIPGTPYITIGGRYLTGPSMMVRSVDGNASEGGSNDSHDHGASSTNRLFYVVESLIQMTNN